MTLNQNNILLTLAYLLGEKSVNSTTSTPRADFIQQSLNEAYQRYPWRFARTNATLTITSFVATLPTNYDDNHSANVFFTDGTQIELDPVDPDDEEELEDGNRAYWIEAVADDRYIFKTKDDDISTMRIRYQKQAPVLDTAGLIVTPYPNKMSIALGARRYVKLGQNPDADISQDETIFQKRLDTDVAFHQVNAPRKRRKTAQGQAGSNTGEF